MARTPKITWTECRDALPPVTEGSFSETYLVTDDTGSARALRWEAYAFAKSGRSFPPLWRQWGQTFKGKVVAWQPLPEPFKDKV